MSNPTEQEFTPVQPEIKFIVPQRRLEPEHLAEEARSEIASVFDIEVSSGSIELRPSNFRTLPDDIRKSVCASVREFRETFRNTVFGEFAVTISGHTTLIDEMPGHLKERKEQLKEKLGDIDRVIVFHQPNMTETPVYDPATGEYLMSLPGGRTNDFPPTKPVF